MSINKYNAQVGAHLLGEEVVLYSDFSELEILTGEVLIIDYIAETRLLLSWMGIDIPVIDYPEELSEFYGRTIREGLMGWILVLPRMVVH